MLYVYMLFAIVRCAHAAERAVMLQSFTSQSYLLLNFKHCTYSTCSCCIDIFMSHGYKILNEVYSFQFGDLNSR